MSKAQDVLDRLNKKPSIDEQLTLIVQQNEQILLNQEEIIEKLANINLDTGSGFNGYDR